MMPSSKKGLWVACIVIGFAGGLFFMDLPIEREISAPQPVYAQMAYSTQVGALDNRKIIFPGDILFSGDMYPGDIMFPQVSFVGDILFSRSSGGGTGTSLTTLMTCGGWCQTMSTCSWNCGATFSFCGTGGTGGRTGQGTTISTCAGSLFGSCGGGTSVTCSSLFGSCGGGTSVTCSGLFGSCGSTSTTCGGLFGGCDTIDPTNTTCGSLSGCGSTVKTCGIYCPITKDTMIDCGIIVGETQLTCLGCSETMFNCENTRDTCNIFTCRNPTTGTCNARSTSCVSTTQTCGNCFFQFSLETTQSPAF